MRAILLILVVGACARPHRHEEPRRHRSKLGVEVRSGGDHAQALRDGAAAGLARVRFTLPVSDRGEVELQLDVKELDVVGRRTMCKVKVLVLRLPTHSLLGVAEGTAWAGGTDGDTARACAEKLAATLTAGRVRPLLRRELRDRR